MFTGTARALGIRTSATSSVTCLPWGRHLASLQLDWANSESCRPCAALVHKQQGPLGTDWEKRQWDTRGAVIKCPSMWWRHGMETLSALLALCGGNPPVTGGFPSQRGNNAERWCYLCCQPEQTVQQTVDSPAIWDASEFVWCCYDATVASRR